MGYQYFKRPLNVTNEIPASSVSNSKLATMTRGTVKVGNSSAAASDLDCKGSAKIMIGDGTDIKSLSVTGDVTISSAAVTAIGSGKVTDAMMVANTLTSASFATNLVQRAVISISSANITGTSAGQLGHANGVVLVAAPGANNTISLNKALVHYTFGTAAYTAGGNVTINWGAGGAAVTGLASAANSFAAASSKSAVFYPLAAAATANVSNASLNLVSTVAFTQPGTATGTIVVEVYYTINAPGF